EYGLGKGSHGSGEQRVYAKQLIQFQTLKSSCRGDAQRGIEVAFCYVGQFESIDQAILSSQHIGPISQQLGWITNLYIDKYGLIIHAAPLNRLLCSAQ